MQIEAFISGVIFTVIVYGIVYKRAEAKAWVIGQWQKLTKKG